MVGAEHTGKYDTLLKIVKKRKLRWFGHAVREKGAPANTILQGKIEGGKITGKASKTVTGQCK